MFLKHKNFSKLNVRTDSSLRTLYLFLTILLFAVPADAYIGPGAGFAFFSSFLVFALSFLAAIFTILMFPLRLLFKGMRNKKEGTASKKIRTDKKVILVGLDGLSPRLLQKFLNKGLLPNF